MAENLHFDFLTSIPWVFFVLAAVAWLATFIGMLRSMARSLGASK